MSRSYVTMLALVAAVVLVVGSLVRRRSLAADTPVAAPPSEAAALQQLSQEAQMRRLSGFLSNRIAAVAPFVTYVDSLGAAAVRWRGDDTVISTTRTRPVVALQASPSDTIRPPVVNDADSAARDWMLVVSRRADGSVVSAATLAGGRSSAHCAGRTLGEYITGVELRDEFAGGGLFGIDGHLLGIVVRCGARQVAVPSSEVERVVADTLSRDLLREVYGIELAPLDDRARAYFRSDSGVLVTAVRRGSAADVSGLRPGDIVLTIGGQSAASGISPAILQRANAAESLEVTRQRGRSVTAIPLVAGTSHNQVAARASFGIEVADAAPRGAAISSVSVGSVAAAAGLHPGDRLVRVGNTAVPSSSVAQRLLIAARGRSTFIVFERDSVERGVLVPQ